LHASSAKEQLDGNIFQAESYSKPIVLLGSGSELGRLAESLVKETGSGKVVVPKDGDSVVK
jgi:hypothetical protein